MPMLSALPSVQPPPEPLNVIPPMLVKVIPLVVMVLPVLVEANVSVPL